MTDNTRIWRLPLPDDWEPADYWCVSFSIPAGDDYVEALSAALGLLTIPKTFERDETHEGAATVARTWERAIYLAPMVVNENCAPVAIPPIPNEAAAADQSAAIFHLFYRHIVSTLNTCAPTPGECAACVDDLFASLVTYGASEAVRGALADVCRKLNDLPPEDRGIYDTDCPYTELFDDLTTKINDNPYDWLNKLSDWIFDWLNQTSDDIFNALNVVAGLMTGAGLQGWLQDNGGVPSGGGATFGGDCEWTHVIDFTETSDGWTNLNDWDTGTWSSGTGWIGEYSEGQYGGADLHVVDIVRPLSVPFSLTYLKMTFSLSGGDWEDSHAPYYAYLAGSGGVAFDENGVAAGSDIVVGGAVGPWSNNTFRIQIMSGYHTRPSHGDPGGSVIVSQVEVHGIGVNPWA